MERFRDGDPNPIGYLWETMADGRCEIGKPNRLFSFVWRMPITRRRDQLIHKYLTHRNNDQFGIRSHNCIDMVTEVAALAGAPLPYTIPELAELAKHCTDREDDTTKAERGSGSRRQRCPGPAG